jgi:hypothetical protein
VDTKAEGSFHCQHPIRLVFLDNLFEFVRIDRDHEEQKGKTS